MPCERALAEACETRPPPRCERQKLNFAAPDRTDWVIDRAQQQATNNYRDYAIVTLFTDTNTGKIAIVAAGVGRGGTIAAGEFLTDPADLAQVVNAARASGKKNMEFVLSTEIIDGQPGTPKMKPPKEVEAVGINLRYIIAPRPGILESAAQSTIT